MPLSLSHQEAHHHTRFPAEVLEWLPPSRGRDGGQVLLGRQPPPEVGGGRGWIHRWPGLHGRRGALHASRVAVRMLYGGEAGEVIQYPVLTRAQGPLATPAAMYSAEPQSSRGRSMRFAPIERSTARARPTPASTLRARVGRQGRRHAHRRRRPQQQRKHALRQRLPRPFRKSSPRS